MTKEFALLNLLADGQFHSGQDCARELGVSRTAIHHAIQKLSDRYQLPIDRLSGRGYRLVDGIDLLHKETLLSLLPQDLPVRDCTLVPILDSTNQFLIEHHHQRAKSASTTAELTHEVADICLAECQTAGRGRRGRQWFSPFARNLTLSLSWTFQRDLAALRGFSLVLGLAVARYLSHLGINDVGLKWPNDIMIAQHKVGGVLLEVAGDAAGPCTVIIGLGLNVNMQDLTVEDFSQPWTDIASHHPDPPQRNQLAADIVTRLIQQCQQFSRTPLSVFLAQWQAYDIYLGQEVICDTPQGSLTGIAEGINDNGEFLLRVQQTRHALNSGEVSVRLR